MKVCIPSSAGGHLTEILLLKNSYDSFDHFFITCKKEDTISLNKNTKVYFVTDPIRNPVSTIVCTFQTLGIMIKERPNIIITTGAGLAIPTCFIGKLLGAKIIFIESFCRTVRSSFSGRVIYHIADKFYVQWEKMKKLYGNKAEYRGNIL